jgi:Flp pilus assembly protein TadG
MVEFALVSPAFLALLMGAFELGYESYMANVLDGTLNRAARSITMESASEATIRAQLDQDLRDTMLITDNDVTLDIKRESVTRYSQIVHRAKPMRI